ncbi:MAG: hypothetical protein WBC95_17180 [Albidovulum sp.]
MEKRSKYTARNTVFCTFPVVLRGKTLCRAINFGNLNVANVPTRARHGASVSASAFGAATKIATNNP